MGEVRSTYKILARKTQL